MGENAKDQTPGAIVLPINDQLQIRRSRDLSPPMALKYENRLIITGIVAVVALIIGQFEIMSPSGCADCQYAMIMAAKVQHYHPTS